MISLSTHATFVEKERSLTVSALGMKRGSLSSHLSGTSAFLSVYTRISKEPILQERHAIEQGSSNKGRNVIDAVICRIIA